MGETQKKEKKKIGLTTKIFIALLAGAVFGIILCYAVPSGHIKDDIIVEGVLYVVGQGFIKLMKMLVVPLVFCSLVCGSMSIGDTKKLGTVGARTLIFYLATTALAVTVALSVGNLINPGVGLDMSTIKTNAASVETMKATSLTDTLLNIIPDNPINSLASGEMLQIIVFALSIGVILAKLGERAETVANFFSQFNDVMMEMTTMVMKLAPYGVFCLTARTFSGIGFANKNLSYYTTSAVLPATEPLSGTPGFPQCTLCRFLRCLSENLTFLYTASIRTSDHSKQLHPSIGQFAGICSDRHMAVPTGSLQKQPLGTCNLLRHDI